jgi:hypothetical protein
MKLSRTMIVGAATIAAGVAIATTALSWVGSPAGPPAAKDPSVPAMKQDKGAGEKLLLVVGGAFPTREAAEEANATISLGDVQGFYVAVTDQFVGLEQRLGRASEDYLLVSAFRTAQGAKEFLDLVQAAGASAFITPRLENLGSVYVGLGQEADPDGGGALTKPIPGLTS